MRVLEGAGLSVMLNNEEKTLGILIDAEFFWYLMH